MSEEYECSECGENFDSKSALGGHMSHHEDVSLHTVDCVMCGEEFTIDDYRYRKSKSKNFYCSSQCQGEGFKGENHPNYNNNLDFDCEYCGDEFRGFTGNVNKYCSQECAFEDKSVFDRMDEQTLQEWKKHHQKRLKNNNPMDNEEIKKKAVKKMTKTRKEQGSPWTPNGQHHPMSDATGSDNPAWKGGTSFEPYPKEFYNKRETIIERDDKKCQQCHMTKEEHYEEYNEDLHVHHIDGDKKNNQDTNLVTLCHKHNIQAEYMTVRPQFNVGEAAK